VEVLVVEVSLALRVGFVLASIVAAIFALVGSIVRTRPSRASFIVCSAGHLTE
jgi:hypothetical protein